MMNLADELSGVHSDNDTWQNIAKDMCRQIVEIVEKENPGCTNLFICEVLGISTSFLYSMRQGEKSLTLDRAVEMANKALLSWSVVMTKNEKSIRVMREERACVATWRPVHSDKVIRAYVPFPDFSPSRREEHPEGAR